MFRPKEGENKNVNQRGRYPKSGSLGPLRLSAFARTKNLKKNGPVILITRPFIMLLYFWQSAAKLNLAT